MIQAKCGCAKIHSLGKATKEAAGKDMDLFCQFARELVKATKSSTRIKEI